MTTVATLPPPTAAAADRLWTIAEFAALPDETPAGPVRHELDNGRLVTMAPTGYVHGRVEMAISAELHLAARQAEAGEVVCGEVGIILWREPQPRLVGADIAFIAAGSLPARRSPEGYLETIPDLVVEVLSKNDEMADAVAKTFDYLRAGVRHVWLADPFRRLILVFRKGQEPERLYPGDELTLDRLIPGFRLAVAEVFPE